MERNETLPMGYLAQNWLGTNDKTPALIVNPEASPLDMLAWIGGELFSLEAAGHALGDMASGDSTIDVDQFTAIFMHRLEPVARVLDLALCELIAQRKAQEEVAPPLKNGGLHVVQP